MDTQWIRLIISIFWTPLTWWIISLVGLGSWIIGIVLRYSFLRKMGSNRPFFYFCLQDYPPILWMRHLLFLITWVCLGLVWLGIRIHPFFLPNVQEAKRILLVVDISRSMLAQDVSPNRWETVINLIHRWILQQSKNHHEFALVVLGGECTLLSPYSTDYAALLSLLHGLHPEMFPPIGSYLRPFTEWMEKHSKNYLGNLPDAVVLFSDGEFFDFLPSGDFPIFSSQSIPPICTIGIGNPYQSSVIPLSSGQLVQYKGEAVTTRLYPESLEALAHASKGQYIRATSVLETIQYLDTFINRIQPSRKIPSEHPFSPSSEPTYQIFLLIGILSLLFALLILDQPISRERVFHRRGWIYLLLIWVASGTIFSGCRPQSSELSPSIQDLHCKVQVLLKEKNFEEAKRLLGESLTLPTLSSLERGVLIHELGRTFHLQAIDLISQNQRGSLPTLLEHALCCYEESLKIIHRSEALMNWILAQQLLQTNPPIQQIDQEILDSIQDLLNNALQTWKHVSQNLSDKVLPTKALQQTSKVEELIREDPQFRSIHPLLQESISLQKQFINLSHHDPIIHRRVEILLERSLDYLRQLSSSNSDSSGTIAPSVDQSPMSLFPPVIRPQNEAIEILRQVQKESTKISIKKIEEKTW